MTTQRMLTGITTTGTPHLGNYVGAIRPGILASRGESSESFFFLADYHALIKCDDPELIRQSSKEIAATWLALGLDTEKAVFYRQSDIPEISELNWILCCSAAKGLMNRAHAYKAVTQANEEAGEDADFAVTMGLFSYPVLMAADILMFNAQKIPVGRDQIQHVEMARDIAQRFNHNFDDVFTLPEAVIGEDALLLGTDGRKMSKSYNNTIPLFLSEKLLRKAINKIRTNLLEPGVPKDPDDSTVFQLWTAFASAQETERMRSAFQAGIAWGEAKKQLFELINSELADARDNYTRLMADSGYIESTLRRGAERAKEHSGEMMCRVREAVGIGSIR
ncbi:MAG: tryptophan--tRNA ligase [Halioglobus sp.]|nr:tryptophan--tRNA ligase [Halioglobus sp.]